jgi:chemotaxis protein MotB
MADASSEKPTIRIKRIKKVAGGHHGGAWKIAYADFVTASEDCAWRRQRQRR